MFDSEKTKEQILEAAIELFAKEGFAGAHVAEIADRAGVNVALIYRYFGSKEQLLEAVIESFIQADQAQRDKVFAKDPLPTSPEQLHNLARWGLEHLSQRRALLKIILFESLRDEGHKELLFQSFDAAVLSRVPAALTERRDDEALELLMAPFFFGAAPMLMAAVFGEQWAVHYGVEPERVRERFLDLFEELYVRHMVDRLSRVRKEMEKET
jgi:AcrR family transcriptional regulator